MKNKFGKLLFILFSIVLCAFIRPNRVLAEGCELTDEELENMFEIQREAVEANDVLYCSFDWDDGYVYPEDFGGTYIDYDTLHVLVTSYNDINRYKDVLDGYSCITYDCVQHSYDELFDYAMNVAKNEIGIEHISYYGVDVVNNKGLIGVCEDYYEYALNCLGEDITLRTSGRVERDVAVMGGSFIQSNGHNFTLGASGTYNGSNVFVTCGHDMTLGSAVTWINNYIGSFSLIQFSNYQTGDYGFINCSNGYTPSPSYYIGGGSYGSYTGYFYNPPSGTYLAKYGISTNQTNCTVSYTGVSVPYTTSLTINNLTLATGTAAGGDSGGLYRYGNLFCGIHSAHNDYNTVFFTPYVYLNAAGFTVATN